MTIGLRQQRARREQELLVEQLHTALASRVVVEHAKGMLAERLKVGTDQAFHLLRQHARCDAVAAAARSADDGQP